MRSYKKWQYSDLLVFVAGSRRKNPRIRYEEVDPPAFRPVCNPRSTVEANDRTCPQASPLAHRTRDTSGRTSALPGNHATTPPTKHCLDGRREREWLRDFRRAA